MTNSEQGQSPWTDERIEKVAADSSTDYDKADNDWFYEACFAMSRNTAEELLTKMRDAWQADRNALIEKASTTNSEQGQSPVWTKEFIERYAQSAGETHGEYDFSCETLVRLSLNDAVNAWAADRNALIERGDALYQAGMSDERDHQNALSRRVEEMHKRERNALVAERDALQQRVRELRHDRYVLIKLLEDGWPIDDIEAQINGAKQVWSIEESKDDDGDE